MKRIFLTIIVLLFTCSLCEAENNVIGKNNLRNSWIASTSVVQYPYSIPITETADIQYFWDWRDYTTGIWTDRITGVSASQTIAINQPTASNTCVVFDGTSDYLTFKTPKFVNQHTATVFFRLNAKEYGVYKSIFNTSVGTEFEVRDSANYGQAYFGNGTVKQSSVEVFTQNSMKTYCIVFTTSDITFYSDGVKKGDSIARIDAPLNLSEMRIGMNIYTQALQMDLKYFMVYGTAKSLSEVVRISSQINALP